MSSVHSARNSIVSLVSSNEPHSHVGSRSGSVVKTKLVDEGAMLPSSSSKDEDILSDSSDEIENIAMQTLEHLQEPQPQVHRKSIVSSQSVESGIRSKRESKADVSVASKSSKVEKKKKANGEISKGDGEEKEDVEKEANIQNEFGICGWILTILSYILIFFTLPISACMCIKVVQEYERAVIFRLGRLMPGGAKGPGIFFIVPCIDTYRKVDLRVLSFEVPPQEILSKDSVTVAVDAVVYFRISNATISVTNVEDSSRSTKLLAQTTLRNILGTKTLAEMLSDREAISLQMQSTLDEATEPWGVKVERVEVKDVRLPVQLQRAMAAEAEAAREARAKVIVAEGEQKASRALKEAAEVIAESPSALQLRYLQTLNSISAEKNSTIIFPFPIDLLSSFLQRAPPKVEEPPPLPKKIRSCCLYKYPDWVQNMVGSNGSGSSGHHHHHGGSPGAPTQGFPTSTTSTGGRPPLPASMREAEYQAPPGSSLSSSVPPLYPSTHSPSVPSPNRSLLTPRSSSSQRSGRPQAPSSSLLKQALANRIGDKKKAINIGPPEPLSKTNALDGTSTLSSSEKTAASDDDERGSVKEKPAKRADDMNASILANPAWYRDHDGRTGFIPEDYEHPKNEQRSQIKGLGGEEEEKTVGNGQLLECFGGKKDEKERRSSREVEGKTGSPKKSSQDRERDSDAAGEYERGRSSHKKHRESSDLSPTKIKKAKERSSEKSGDRRSSGVSEDQYADSQQHKDRSKLSAKRDDMGMSEASKESKKSKDRSDSISSQQDGSQSSPGKSSRKLQDPPESKKSESLSSVSGQESESSSSKSETKSKLRKFKEGLGFGSKKGATEEALSPDSRRFSDAFVVQKFKDLEARRSSTQLEVPTQFRKSKNRSPSESPRRSPEDSRRESTDSRISASSLIQAALGRPTQVDTVPVSSLPAITIQADTPQTENAHNNNGRPLGATSALPPLPSSTRGRPRLQDVQQSSTESSADPDYRPISGIRKLPLSSSSAISSTSEDRRGSSQSESSRVSLATHKSVTFSDHIQVTEIERKERELEEEHSSSSEEESSIVSTRPVHVRRKRSDEETAVPGFSDGYHSEDVNPAHQEDYALKYDSDESNTVQYSYAYEAPSASSSSSADVDSGVLEQPDAPLRKEHEATGSIQASETTLPPSQSLQSVYREDELGPDYQTEFTLNQLNLLPEKVREAVLHELMESGYSGQDINVPMSGSMTRLHAEDSRSPSVASFQGFPRSASGYLDNPDLSPMYQHYPQIGGERQLEQERSQSMPPQEDQRLKGIDESFYDNVPSTSQITSPAHQKPPSGRPKTFRFSTNLHGEDGASSSSISPETPEEETEMRKKFVALYGNRRAPIANASDTEECPKDPAPSGRRGSASGFSTDSWESIVSATSMRAESKLRRNFNY